MSNLSLDSIPFAGGAQWVGTENTPEADDAGASPCPEEQNPLNIAYMDLSGLMNGVKVTRAARRPRVYASKDAPNDPRLDALIRALEGVPAIAKPPLVSNITDSVQDILAELEDAHRENRQ